MSALRTAHSPPSHLQQLANRHWRTLVQVICLCLPRWAFLREQKDRHGYPLAPQAQIRASYEAQRQCSIPDAGFLTLSKVLELYPIGKALWDAGVRTGRYPAPVRLAPRVLAWKASKIRRFLVSVESGERLPIGKRGFVTFEQVARQWITKRQHELSPSTANSYLRRLEMYVFPYIGTLPPDAIMPQHIIPLLQRAERAASVEIAYLMKGNISAVFRFAVVNGFASVNPAATFCARDVITMPTEERHHAAAPSTSTP